MAIHDLLPPLIDDRDTSSARATIGFIGSGEVSGSCTGGHRRHVRLGSPNRHRYGRRSRGRFTAEASHRISGLLIGVGIVVALVFGIQYGDSPVGEGSLLLRPYRHWLLQ